MRINVLFFAKLREEVGENKLSINLEEFSSATIKDLFDDLSTNYKRLSLYKGEIKAALNQEMVKDWNIKISDGDEIAFFPPITGG
jgi:molybdopterin converting factor subunit 1